MRSYCSSYVISHCMILFTSFGLKVVFSLQGLPRKEKKIKVTFSVNLLPHMTILGSSNSAANKDMMSKILTNGDTII